MDGTKLSVSGTKNDVTASVASGGQYLNVAWQVFDPNLVIQSSKTPTYCWVQVTSTTTGLAGFYIEFDDSVTFQSGGDLGTFGTDLYLPAIDNSGTTVSEISLVNADTSTNGGVANVTVDFLKADGTSVSGGSKSLTLAQAAALQGPLASVSAFSGVAFDQVAALRVRSDRPVLTYGIVKPQAGGKTPIALPGQDVTTPSQTLYFAQLADGQISGGAAWSTRIGISNLNFAADTLVNITAYKPDGSIYVDPTITNPASVTIPKGGFFSKSFTELFPFTDTSYKDGWLKVDASSPAINGFVEYGSGNNRALVIAQLNPFQLSMFSHQAQAASCPTCNSYFTGLAILNSSTLAANVEVFSLDKDGNTIGRKQTVLKPGQRTSQLLFQLVSESDQKNGGSVFVRSDRPVFTTELFAVNDKGNVNALANVPPQQVTASFSPKSTLATITPSPQLAVIETGKTKTFTVPAGSGTITWSVVGPSGVDIGSINSSSGLYTAPGKAPAPHTLTIQAASSAGNNSGASSIDVVQREQLTGGLTTITAVAYLENLKRFFVAEQKLISSAPAIGFAATTANTQIYEVVKSGSTTTNTPYIPVISGDTIAKMLPYENGGKSYMLLAGRDSGKIYRLEISDAKTLKTVKSGFIQPTSMALDPITGNLLVAEAGAQQISIVTAAEIQAASEPSVAEKAPGAGRRLPALAVPDIQGIAIDWCTGSVYISNTLGQLVEYQGSSTRVVETGLDHPTQLVAVYRTGFSCANALTIGIVEATKVSLSYPKSQITRTTLLDLSGISDITILPKDNPFTSGGEASLCVAQPSTSSTQGTVTDVPMGGAYQFLPPISVGSLAGLFSGTGPNADPIGDTFDDGIAAEYGYSVPDIVSVTGSTQGGQSIITIKFAAPVTLGTPYTGGPNPPPDALWAFIFMRTTAGSQVLQQYPIQITWSEYFPFGDPGNWLFDSFMGVFYGELWYSSVTGQSAVVKASAIGNTLTLSVPTTALDLNGTTAIILVGNPAEFTDAAPNNGVLKLSQ